MGFPPISTIGFGLYSVSSRKRVPIPPQRIITFILNQLQISKTIINKTELKTSKLYYKVPHTLNMVIYNSKQIMMILLSDYISVIYNASDCFWR